MTFICIHTIPLSIPQMVRPWRKKRKGKRIVNSCQPRRVLACMAVQRQASVPNMFKCEFQMLMYTLRLITTVVASSYEIRWRSRGYPHVRMAFLMAESLSSAKVGAVIAAAFDFWDDKSWFVTSDVIAFESICAGHE